MAVDVAQLLAFAVKNNASDLHLSAGVPPMIRVDGDMKRINMPALSHKEVHGMVYDIMNDKQRKNFEEFFETDFSFEIPKLARFRVNAFNQNRGAGAVFRNIPSTILSLDELAAPKIFRDLCMLPRGLVLVTGPTGSGKSTTLAGMVNHCNDNRPDHIITIEDPIEFVHESKRCLMNQREVHRDTLGFSEALRSALREDPDVVLVGEMRDLETIRLALTAAETGHLVFGTLHTSSAAKTIDRVVDVFPAQEKEMVRAMLSESLRAVISQTLLKRNGGGRIAAHEIMIGTPAIRNLIREGKIAQMYSAIQTGAQQGMQTLDQCLAELVTKGVVSKEEARYKASNKDACKGSMDREQGIKLMQDLLRRVVEKKASDLFITAGFPPAIKIDGEVRPQSERALTAEQSAVLVRSIMNDRQTKEFDATKECNFAIAPPGIGRFRVNTFVQQGNTGCVIRLINSKIPTLEELELPPVLKEVVLSKRGLVIMVGGTGSGKSTSLAAMVGYRNEKTRGHIVTIEDPVEYVHQHKGCVITHREVGVDTDNWHAALKNTLRQAPGRHPHRRNPRSRDDGIRHSVRRNRPPGAGDAARQQLQPGARPHHQLLPRRAARTAADGPVAEHPRAGFAAPDAARSRRRPHRRDGDHAEFAADPGPDLQRQGPGDQGSHVALHAHRHEDLRPGAVRPVRDRFHLLRRRAAQRRLQERAAPAHQAREQARSEEPRRRRHAVDGR